jgi:hypothetical protein
MYPKLIHKDILIMAPCFTLSRQHPLYTTTIGMCQIILSVLTNQKPSYKLKPMSSKANILKKFRRWLRKVEEKPMVKLGQNSISLQVGKLLRERGSEVITMTTL